MKQKAIWLLCLTMTLPLGCATLKSDPNAEIKASAQVFSATVNVLAELKRQGQLGNDELKDVSAMIHLGAKYLYQWREAIRDGQQAPQSVAAFQVILTELMKIQENHHDAD